MKARIEVNLSLPQIRTIANIGSTTRSRDHRSVEWQFSVIETMELTPSISMRLRVTLVHSRSLAESFAIVMSPVL
jgi:hypothetical protein